MEIEKTRTTHHKEPQRAMRQAKNIINAILLGALAIKAMADIHDSISFPLLLTLVMIAITMGMTATVLLTIKELWPQSQNKVSSLTITLSLIALFGAMLYDTSIMAYAPLLALVMIVINVFMND